MSNYLVTDTELTQTAAALRTKGGTSEQIEWGSGTGFKSAIEALPSGGGGGMSLGTSFGGVTPLRVVTGETVSIVHPTINTYYGGTE